MKKPPSEAALRRAQLCHGCHAMNPLPGRRRCPTCAAVHRVRSVQIRDARRAAGRCIACNQPTADGRSYCDVHLGILRARRKKARAD